MRKDARIIKRDMLSIFLEDRKPDLPYNILKNKVLDKNIYNADQLNIKSNITFIFDFPSYLKPGITDKAWTLKTIDCFKGSMIALKNYDGVDAYLKHNFSSKRRSKFRTYQKRLETAFNIRYETYCGAIDLETYESLFKSFYALIERRFAEKKMKNYDLTRWDIYHKIAYPLIKKKEAALFVIYHDDTPISICLNLIRNQVIYGYLRAYDIDYSKFYLGFIDFIKQLHWCYANDIKIFDLLKGRYAYKSYLVDSEYYFQKHIIYKNTSFISKLYGQLFYLRIKWFYNIINLLKKINIHKLYHAFLEYRHRNQNHIVLTPYQFSQANQENIVDPSEKIDLNHASNQFLKRPVYDFLYRNQEAINTLEIFKLGEDDRYLLKGAKQSNILNFQ